MSRARLTAWPAHVYTTGPFVPGTLSGDHPTTPWGPGYELPPYDLEPSMKEIMTFREAVPSSEWQTEARAQFQYVNARNYVPVALPGQSTRGVQFHEEGRKAVSPPRAASAGREAGAHRPGRSPTPPRPARASGSPPRPETPGDDQERSELARRRAIAALKAVRPGARTPNAERPPWRVTGVVRDCDSRDKELYARRPSTTKVCASHRPGCSGSCVCAHARCPPAVQPRPAQRTSSLSRPANAARPQSGPRPASADGLQSTRQLGATADADADARPRDTTAAGLPSSRRASTDLRDQPYDPRAYGAPTVVPAAPAPPMQTRGADPSELPAASGPPPALDPREVAAFRFEPFEPQFMRQLDPRSYRGFPPSALWNIPAAGVRTVRRDNVVAPVTAAAVR